VMLGGRAALAAIVAASLWAGVPGRTTAQTVAEAPAAEPQKPAEGSPPKPAESGAQKAPDDTVSKSRLVSILGREITNREGDGGRVIDVLIDLDGGPGAVVMEFGGFLGIGSRKVAVVWSALRFIRDGNRTLLTADITREQIRDAPEYKPNEPPSVLGK
jgi:hypothetical protein